LFFNGDSDNESGDGGMGNLFANEMSPREQDQFLPITNVSRIMKKALPANAKICKDIEETVQECMSELISFVTREAFDKCQRKKHKEDVGSVEACICLGRERREQQRGGGRERERK
jgi:histone H3/H4